MLSENPLRRNHPTLTSHEQLLKLRIGDARLLPGVQLAQQLGRSWTRMLRHSDRW
jgi:hypothetical protein